MLVHVPFIQVGIDLMDKSTECRRVLGLLFAKISKVWDLLRQILTSLPVDFRRGYILVAYAGGAQLLVLLLWLLLLLLLLAFCFFRVLLLILIVIAIGSDRTRG